jgi:Phage terminase large subunit
MTISLPWGGTIIFWSLEGGDSVKGLNVTYALIDKVTDIAEQSFDDVFDRIGRQGAPGRMWVMRNPGNKFHWFYKRFWKEYEEHGNRPENGAYCVALTYRDNPHTESKWAHWEKFYGSSPIQKARKLDGLWINTDGMVFPGWDPDRHTFEHARRSAWSGSCTAAWTSATRTPPPGCASPRSRTARSTSTPSTTRAATPTRRSRSMRAGSPSRSSPVSG